MLRPTNAAPENGESTALFSSASNSAPHIQDRLQTPPAASRTRATDAAAGSVQMSVMDRETAAVKLLNLQTALLSLKGTSLSLRLHC